MMDKTQKRAIVISILVIVITVVLYFLPVLKGKVLFQYDMISGGSAMHALHEYKEKFGELPLWTPRIFSGMPTLYLGFEKKPNWAFVIFYHLRGHLYPIQVMIVGLIGFFVMLLILGVRPYLALGASIAFGFFSYNMQIIEAGHITKFQTIMTAPWIFAGLFMLFDKKKTAWALLILLFAMPLQINSGHIQITYYMVIIALIYWFYELIMYIKSKQIKLFVLKSLLVGSIVMVTLLLFAPNQYPLYSYAKYSIRGPSELVRDKKQKKYTGGLDKDYAYSWSYGRKELLTLIAPGALGEGSTYELGEDSKFYEWLVSRNVPNAYKFAQQAPTYWGEQPFVSGGIYIGAVILTLFVVALFFDVPIMLPFIVATLLGILLALGKHSVSVFSGIILISLPIVHSILKKKLKMPPYKLGTILFFIGFVILLFDGGGYRIIDLFFDYVPLFNKFRVPTTHLVMVAFCVPLVAAVGVNNFLDKNDWNYVKQRLIYATVIVLGLLGFFWLFGSELFSFSGPNDSKFQFPQELLNALKEDRINMYKKDLLRAILYALASIGVLWAYAKKYLESTRVVSMALTILIMLDNIPVGLRYLSHDDFVEPEDIERVKAPKPWVQVIQQDTTYFRVFPLSENPFNDGHTPYYLNTIGGYSPAKLKRYQQLIEEHISKGVPNVLNMLNTKYIIHTDTLPIPFFRPIKRTPDGRIIHLNLTNYGPAWITPKVIIAKIPDEALDTLDNVYSKEIAVIEQKDAKYLEPFDTSKVDSSEYIKLVYHSFMKLVYEYNSPKKRFVTFSEIYYPGWKLYVDGKETHVFHTNFVLRGAIIPPGKHKLVFKFEPEVIKIASILGYIGFFSWLLLLGVAVFLILKERKNK